jgi:hypothetical protein
MADHWLTFCMCFGHCYEIVRKSTKSLMWALSSVTNLKVVGGYCLANSVMMFGVFFSKVSPLSQIQEPAHATLEWNTWYHVAQPGFKILMLWCENACFMTGRSKPDPSALCLSETMIVPMRARSFDRVFPDITIGASAWSLGRLHSVFDRRISESLIGRSKPCRDRNWPKREVFSLCSQFWIVYLNTFAETSRSTLSSTIDHSDAPIAVDGTTNIFTSFFPWTVFLSYHISERQHHIDFSH